MAKVDVSSEIVKNHSTEEVVAYLKKELTRLNELCIDETKDETFRLGAVSQGLASLLPVVIHLDAKLTVSTPVVA